MTRVRGGRPYGHPPFAGHKKFFYAQSPRLGGDEDWAEGVCMLYISNSFSLSMLEGKDVKEGVYLYFEEVDTEFVKTWLGKYDWSSCIGHSDTAVLLSEILGVEIPVNRVSIKLTHHSDFVFVAQYIGPRLPEGATTLPEGAQIKFVKVGFFELGI